MKPYFRERLLPVAIKLCTNKNAFKIFKYLLCGKHFLKHVPSQLPDKWSLSKRIIKNWVCISNLHSNTTTISRMASTVLSVHFTLLVSFEPHEKNP